MSKNEKALLNHLVRIWRAPHINDAWQSKYYNEAEGFLEKNYPEWVHYISSAEAVDELVINDKLKP